MKLEIDLNGATHVVEIVPNDGRLQCTIDGSSVEADARRIGPGLYSILIAGRSFEVSVANSGDSVSISVNGKESIASIRDPRKWRRNHLASSLSEQHQDIVAPMPGRVVRMLVVPGDTVKPGQGIAVVEAMKMQNEVRSPRAGIVERVLVKEGQPVNAGETVAVIA
jgi:biotin carboxyl carrier protein